MRLNAPGDGRLGATVKYVKLDAPSISVEI
jgi:hypothetical protein